MGLLTVARGTWYRTHAERTTAAGLDALQDQQLAGLLMWVPGGVLLLAAALALAIAWLGALEHRMRRQGVPAEMAAQLSSRRGAG
jgi:cytochrome c oxidase assembly factor CtaG